jgi:hypothetical protein
MSEGVGGGIENYRKPYTDRKENASARSVALCRHFYLVIIESGSSQWDKC